MNTEEESKLMFGNITVMSDIVEKMKINETFRRFILRSLERYLGDYKNYCTDEYSGKEIFATYWLRGTSIVIWIATAVDRSKTIVRFPSDDDDMFDI